MEYLRSGSQRRRGSGVGFIEHIFSGWLDSQSKTIVEGIKARLRSKFVVLFSLDFHA